MAVGKAALGEVEDITRAILVLRGRRVLLDAELAVLYGVTTRRLNEQVRRNRKRFPDDFLFELTTEEFANLKSRFATSSWGGRRKRPLAFTEHGAIQAATILNSPRAVEMSVYVVRAFVELREVLSESSLGASNSLSHAWIANSRSMTKPSPRSSRQSANSCGHETRRAAASVSPPSCPTIASNHSVDLALVLEKPVGENDHGDGFAGFAIFLGHMRITRSRVRLL